MKRFHLFSGKDSALGWQGYNESSGDLDELITHFKRFMLPRSEWAHILETKSDGSLNLVARLIENDFAFYGEYKETVVE